MKKSDKSSTKNNTDTYSSDDMKRYLGSLQEHTDDRFKPVIEGQQGINQRLNTMQADIDNIKSDVIIIKSDVFMVKSDVKEIKKDTNQKIENKEFEALARRVSVVEKKITH